MTRSPFWTCLVGATVLFLALATISSPAAGKRFTGAPKLEPGKIHHLSSKQHGRAYSLYVPGSYSSKTSWPLVISSHGRSSRGKKEIGGWTGPAKSHGFIVVCPDMLTATTEQDLPGTSGKPRAEEDEEVLLSIFATVSSQFRVNRRAVMISGFSGGGNPSYWTGLRHPDIFTHICTRGGNWAPQELPKDEKVVAAGKDRLQIYIFYGEKDHPLILGEGGKPGQAVQAYEALKGAGYANLTIEKVPGMKHESRPKKAADWFGEFLVANRKKFAAGDEIDGLVDDANAAIAKKDWRKAGRVLTKARDLEEKHGLDSRAEGELAALNDIGVKFVGDAKEAHAAGDTSLALRLLDKVTRGFRGLPVYDEALALKKEWKK